MFSMNIRLFIACGVLFGLPVGCSPKQGTFGYDLEFLRKHDTGLVVLRSGGSRVIVSPKYQGKVFTSTLAGDAGPSFGWIHYKAFDTVDAHMNAYGGENRLWLGPEGGRFSLFFPPGAKMEFANWKTPAALDSEPWTVDKRTESMVEMHKRMVLTNYAGRKLDLVVGRSVKIFSGEEIAKAFGIEGHLSVKMVGYRTRNSLQNLGNHVFDDSTGMPCLWVLDMMNPSTSTVIIIPYHSEPGDSSKPATTDYFGEIPSDRIKFGPSAIFFKADGHSRGKLGVHPTRATTAIGSYDPERGVLTIAGFNVDPHERYLNQEWNTVKAPFSGDAVNAYNDGPLADGSQMGPFYELESVSPAWSLNPDEVKVHYHAVFHFTGPEAALDTLSKKWLGVSIEQIKGAFPR
jgi:hypothetical protein